MEDLIPSIDPPQILNNLLVLTVAFVMALPIGWNRERSSRNLGFRTFPLVAMASAAYVLIGRTFVESGDAFSRLLQGLMTGVGFLGGGAIVKEGTNVKGLSTAAAVWATAALGAAVASRHYEIAIAIAATTFAVLTWLKPFGHQVDDEVDED
jgi:putative Mg2+ transporter-C (MgtC) family protein